MITISTWNVNSLRARLPLVLHYLETYRPHVLCLQETRIGAAAFPQSAFEAAGYHVASTGAGGYAGVAVASTYPIDETVSGIDSFVEKRAPGRRLLCRIGSLWIDTVYVPTRMAIGKSGFLEGLRRDHIARFDGAAPDVLAGDFNICFDARDYASPSMITAPDVHPNRPEDLAFRALVSGRLVDCFRRKTADGGHFSWFPMAPWAPRRNYGMRLDYLFATEALAARLADVVHDRETRDWQRPSDHVPVRASFDVDVSA
ncbi:MAG TPA: exodeoxyribonuclease III [Candidatus Limnocylindrales bacterium]|nr:exodeoxyribonuclease III [Candidatus Limnocylindrales bacterium]